MGGFIGIIREDIVGREFCTEIFIECFAGLLYLLCMCWAGHCLVALFISYAYFGFGWNPRYADCFVLVGGVRRGALLL